MKKLILIFALLFIFGCKKEETITPSKDLGKLTAYYNLPLDGIYLKSKDGGYIYTASSLEVKPSDIPLFKNMVTIEKINPNEYQWYIFELKDSSWICSDGIILIEAGKTSIIKSVY